MLVRTSEGWLQVGSFSVGLRCWRMTFLTVGWWEGLVSLKMLVLTQVVKLSKDKVTGPWTHDTPVSPQACSFSQSVSLCRHSFFPGVLVSISKCYHRLPLQGVFEFISAFMTSVARCEWKMGRKHAAAKSYSVIPATQEAEACLVCRAEGQPR